MFRKNNVYVSSKIQDLLIIIIIIVSFVTRLYMQVSHRPALVDVVNGQGAKKEDEEYSYEHVVDGPDVADLKQFTDEEEKTQERKIT